jgi:predicted secreted protein
MRTKTLLTALVALGTAGLGAASLASAAQEPVEQPNKVVVVAKEVGAEVKKDAKLVGKAVKQDAKQVGAAAKREAKKVKAAVNKARERNSQRNNPRNSNATDPGSR